eukprot:1233941-Pleurochrysis_carterae.AAC.2
MVQHGRKGSRRRGKTSKKETEGVVRRWNGTERERRLTQRGKKSGETGRSKGWRGQGGRRHERSGGR